MQQTNSRWRKERSASHNFIMKIIGATVLWWMLRNAHWWWWSNDGRHICHAKMCGNCAYVMALCVCASRALCNACHPYTVSISNSFTAKYRLNAILLSFVRDTKQASYNFQGESDTLKNSLGYADLRMISECKFSSAHCTSDVVLIKMMKRIHNTNGKAHIKYLNYDWASNLTRLTIGHSLN